MVYSPEIEFYQIKYTQITFLGLVNIKENIGFFSESSPESCHKWKLGLKTTEKKTPEHEHTKIIMWDARTSRTQKDRQAPRIRKSVEYGGTQSMNFSGA